MVKFPDTTLHFDIETHSITERWDWSPKEYFRLGGYAWGEGPVTLTDSYDEMIAQIEKAERIVGHNIHNFDLCVLYGYNSMRPLHLAKMKRVFDTFTHATLAMPAPYEYQPRTGRPIKGADQPGKAKKYFKLDNLAYQLGVGGKLLDLNELAEQYEYDIQPQYSKTTGKLLKTPLKIRRDVCCGFGHIPLGNTTFREYLQQDVVATREVARKLLEKMPIDAYAWRAQEDAAIDAQIHRNGIRVDMGLVNARIFRQEVEQAYLLEDLRSKYGFPVKGKKPTASKAGKEAIAAALESVGIGLDALDKTDTGNPSFGGDSIKKAAGFLEIDGQWKRPEEGDQELFDLVENLAILAGMRSMPDLTKECTRSDGKVHPEFAALQKSGRKSITNPGLTVFDNKHKDYFIPDDDDHVIMCFDYSNADARAVAAYSGDKVFAQRFEPGQDGHMINAIAAWGKELVSTDPKTYRQRAKAPGHGWGYRIGARKLSKTTGLTLSEAKNFLDKLNKKYPTVVRWQNYISKLAKSQGFVVNAWGRRMPVDPDRAFTQGPALEGQSATTEIMRDGLMKMPPRIIRMIRLTVHDEVVACMPKKTLAVDAAEIVGYLEASFHPEGGQRIDFPVEHGRPGKTWLEAVH